MTIERKVNTTLGTFQIAKKIRVLVERIRVMAGGICALL